jgi:hypothetical protein
MPLPPLNKLAAQAISTFKARFTSRPIQEAMERDPNYAIYRIREVLYGPVTEEHIDYAIALLLLYKNGLQKTPG